MFSSFMEAAVMAPFLRIFTATLGSTIITILVLQRPLIVALNPLIRLSIGAGVGMAAVVLWTGIQGDRFVTSLCTHSYRGMRYLRVWLRNFTNPLLKTVLLVSAAFLVLFPYGILLVIIAIAPKMAELLVANIVWGSMYLGIYPTSFGLLCCGLLEAKEKESTHQFFCRIQRNCWWCIVHLNLVSLCFRAVFQLPRLFWLATWSLNQGLRLLHAHELIVSVLYVAIATSSIAYLGAGWPLTLILALFVSLLAVAAFGLARKYHDHLQNSKTIA